LKQVTRLNTAQQQLDVMIDMILNLLDISKMEEGRLGLKNVEFDLHAAIDTHVAGLAAAARKDHIALDTNLQSGSAVIFADEELITRVIGNLMSNALKHTPENGKVVVGTKDEDGGGKVLVFVTDTGPGISEEYHELIFEKFGQVEARSAGMRTARGLGLTFCKMAVEAHGGKIWVESEPGKGSTFTFSLPLR